MSNTALLRKVTMLFDVAGRVLPEPAGLVARLIGEGLALAADLESAGHEPLSSIQRIRNVDPKLVAIDQRWRSRMLRRLGELESLPPPATSSAEDIYESELDTEARIG